MSLPEHDRTEAMTDAMVEAARVADAILFEGYLLYPYRKSSAKNRVRWQFGVLAPRAWIEARGPVTPTVAGSAESWYQQTECLLRAPLPSEISLRLRFLQFQRKAVERFTPTGGFDFVESLSDGKADHVSFDEAVPQEIDVRVRLGDLVGAEHRVPVHADGWEHADPLAAPDARLLGRTTRTRYPLRATLALSAEVVAGSPGLLRLRAVVRNDDETVPVDATRQAALARSLLATHCLLEVDRGAFVSLLEPPQGAETAARQCVNVHTFPVLAGSSGDRLVLSSPILLYDRPEVAVQSPGDLFDAGEIDEILSLRILTLTEEEKREARATDPRAASMVDRVDAMPDEVLAGLHGTWREPGRNETHTDTTPPAPDRDWWDPLAEAAVSPTTDEVTLRGHRVAHGSRVRLHPRPGGTTDAHDMFLEGMTAVVEAVFFAVDGGCQLGVILEDDPASDIDRQFRRYRYFSTEEVEPLGT